MLTNKKMCIRDRTLNVQMKEDNQTLEEVVVIGYGVQKKRDMTGSSASIKSKDITAIPTTNALEALQGKVAGLDLTNSSGQAGRTPNSVSYTHLDVYKRQTEYFNSALASSITYSSIHSPAVFPLTFFTTVEKCLGLRNNCSA